MTLAVGQHAGTISGSTAAKNTAASGSHFLVGLTDVLAHTHVVSDNKGNVLSPLNGGVEIVTATGVGLSAYLVENGVGGTGHVFSVSGGVAPSLFFVEILGAPTSGEVDLPFSGQRDPGTPFTPGNATMTAQAIELVISLIALDSGTNPSVISVDSGFTILDSVLDGANQVTGALAYSLLSSQTIPNPNWTEPNSIEAAVGLISFKEASGGGGTNLNKNFTSNDIFDIGDING